MPVLQPERERKPVMRLVAVCRHDWAMTKRAPLPAHSGKIQQAAPRESHLEHFITRYSSRTLISEILWAKCSPVHLLTPWSRCVSKITRPQLVNPDITWNHPIRCALSGHFWVKLNWPVTNCAQGMTQTDRWSRGKGSSALLRTEVSLLVPVTHFQDAVLLPVSIRKRMAISLPLLLLFPDKPETPLVLLKSQAYIFPFCFPSMA